MSRNAERLCWCLLITILVLVGCESRQEKLTERAKGEGRYVLHCLGDADGSASYHKIEIDCFEVQPEVKH